MKYTKTTKQGYKIIARGFNERYGIIIIAERKFENRKDYVVGTFYNEKEGTWGQGHYMTLIATALELFSLTTITINWIEYHKEAE